MRQLLGIIVIVLLAAPMADRQCCPGAEAPAQQDGGLINFTADWCGPCQQMKPILAEIENDGWRIVTVDIDRHADIASRYGVEKIPTYIAIRRGQVVGRITGLTTRQALLRLLNQPRK